MKAMVTPAHDQLRKRLLLEGAESYLEAYTALLEYEREVQKKCRRVMQTYLGDYRSAIGLGAKGRVKDGVIENVALPDRKEWDGTMWQLGVKIAWRDVLLGNTLLSTARRRGVWI
jgi:hypothetical protein